MDSMCQTRLAFQANTIPVVSGLCAHSAQHPHHLTAKSRPAPGGVPPSFAVAWLPDEQAPLQMQMNGEIVPGVESSHGSVKDILWCVQPVNSIQS